LLQGAPGPPGADEHCVPAGRRRVAFRRELRKGERTFLSAILERSGKSALRSGWTKWTLWTLWTLWTKSSHPKICGNPRNLRLNSSFQLPSAAKPARQNHHAIPNRRLRQHCA
jgi:hypothetical protein